MFRQHRFPLGLSRCNSRGSHLEKVRANGIEAEIVTSTPITERMELLEAHENGKIEAMVSVGVLAEGWDNPHCNLIVHCDNSFEGRGQTVGRGSICRR